MVLAVRDAEPDVDPPTHTARALASGQDAIDRFLNWKLPPGDEAQDEDAADNDGDDDDVVD